MSGVSNTIVAKIRKPLVNTLITLLFVHLILDFDVRLIHLRMEMYMLD